MKAFGKLLVGIIMISLLGGCAGKQTQKAEDLSASRSVFAMDTYISVTCYGEECEAAADASIQEIERLDDLLSVGKPESEISMLNASGQEAVSEDTANMIEKALELYRTTNGAFDITVFPLMELWGFTTGDFAVPDEAALQERLSACGSGKLSFEGDRLTLGSGQGIDLGGIAKGYTSDRLMEVFERYHLTAGIVSLGGNVQCYRTKPDGSLWRCGIQDPANPGDESSLIGIVSVSDKAVITSGAYERYFVDEATGNTYHHILDPKTGYPSDSGLTSVTVVSESGMLADGLSTACYVMGLEKASEYWREYGEDFDLILADENGAVYVTAPLADSFQSEYEVHVIEK